jgi:hypothetical protein
MEAHYALWPAEDLLGYFVNNLEEYIDAVLLLRMGDKDN